MTYTINNQPAGIDWEADGALARTLQNAKNLLMTQQGEVPYDRYRGMDTGLHDLSIGRVKERIAEDIRIAMMWEPDVTVKAVRCQTVDGALYVEADLIVSDDLA